MVGLIINPFESLSLWKFEIFKSDKNEWVFDLLIILRAFFEDILISLDMWICNSWLIHGSLRIVLMGTNLVVKSTKDDRWCGTKGRKAGSSSSFWTFSQTRGEWGSSSLADSLVSRLCCPDPGKKYYTTSSSSSSSCIPSFFLSPKLEFYSLFFWGEAENQIYFKMWIFRQKLSKEREKKKHLMKK